MKTRSNTVIAKRLVALNSTVAVFAEEWSVPNSAYAVNVTIMKEMKSLTVQKQGYKRSTITRWVSTTFKAAGARGLSARRTTVSVSSEDLNVMILASAKNV